MKELTIQPQKEGKGRAFSATLVSYVECRSISERGNDTLRPIFMALAGTDQELRPFIANLRTGKKAEDTSGYRRSREKYEVLKSSGFQVSWQRHAKGTLVNIFAPDVFCLDPGMVDPKGVQFVLLPAKSWLRPSTVDVPDFVPEDRKDDVRSLAPLFIAYLDRRTRCPLIPDPAFHVRVLANAIGEGLATFSRTDANRYSEAWGESSALVEYGTDEVGLAPGVFFSATHDVLEEFLARQVKEHFENEQPKSRRAA